MCTEMSQFSPFLRLISDIRASHKAISIDRPVQSEVVGNPDLPFCSDLCFLYPETAAWCLLLVGELSHFPSFLPRNYDSVIIAHWHDVSLPVTPFLVCWKPMTIGAPLW